MASVLLPGDEISPDQLPTSKKPSKALTIGPGLKFTPPSCITTTVTGVLSTDNRKHTAWIENSGRGRYTPSVGDLVIATVHHSSMELYHCTLAAYAPMASLGQLAFEGVSRKTRPMLHSGSLVYARISSAHKDMDAELECVHPSTGKSEGMGELKDGMLFDVSLGLARRLMMTKSREEDKVVLLDELGEKGLRFEIAVGRNGKVWINSDMVKTTLAIGRAVQEIDDRGLGLAEQEKLVKAVMRKLQ